MMKSRIILLMIAFSCLFLNAQQTRPYPEIFREFTLKYTPPLVSNSLFDKIKLLDLRGDTVRLGQCQFGLLNKKFTLTPKPFLSIQLASIISRATNQSAKNGELVLCLKKFMFAERTAAFTEEGFCSFDADLYRKTDSLYYLIQSIDTLIRVRSMDVTKGIIHRSDSVFTCFVTRNLLNEGNLNNPLSLKEVVSADSIAKHKLKLYNTPNLVNGIYTTYENFKNQTPDKSGIVERKKDKIKSIKITTDNGVEQMIKPQDIYAVVTDGIPFIATEFGYYPLRLRNDDFVFIGKLPAPAIATGATFFFGLMGTLLSSDYKKSAYFYSVLNFRDGRFIRVREILFGKDESEESNWYYNQ